MSRIPRLILIAGWLLLSGALPVAVFGQQGDLIDLGQVITGEISNEVPELFFNLDGASGDTIVVSMSAIEPGLDSYLYLRDPQGETIFSDDDSGGNLNSLLGPFTLPESGMYTVVATRCCGGGGGSSGPFELVVNRAELFTLTPDESVTINLSQEQPTQHFTFVHTPAHGDVFRLTGEIVDGGVGLSVTIKNARGELINSGSAFGDMPLLIDPLTFSNEDSFLISLRRELSGPSWNFQDDATLRAQIRLEGIETFPIELGQTVTGLLNDEDPTDHFTFHGTASDLLRLTGSHSDGSQPIEVMVVAPNSNFINGSNTAFPEPSSGSFVLDPLQLFSEGDYQLIVRRIDPDGQGISRTSDYTLTLDVSQTPWLEAGVEALGTVGMESFERVYRYEGTAGESVRITLRSVNDSYGPQLFVQGPAVDMPASSMGHMGGGGGPGFNANLMSNEPATMSYETEFPETGIYLFRVNNMMSGQEGPLTGEFGLLLESAS